jgi:hypothetical protein
MFVTRYSMRQKASLTISIHHHNPEPLPKRECADSGAETARRARTIREFPVGMRDGGGLTC